MAATRKKVLSLRDAADRVASARRAGETVVLCHGCFDLVHPGHIRHLEHAARLGTRLLVTVTCDDAVAKGPDRPLIPQELRAENLAALDCVDWVAISDRPTAAALLDDVRPDVYVKGREYEHNRDPRFAEEKRVVAAYGGRVVLTSGDVVFSSTALQRDWASTADPAHGLLVRHVARHDLDAARLHATLRAVRGKRVLVVGETIRDTYVLCDRPDVAGEGPVLSLRPIERRHFDGGAAIVARHLAALGAVPTLFTGLPATPEGRALALRLDVEGVTVRGITVPGPIVEKQRFLVHTQKMMKLDLGEFVVLDEQRQREMIETVADLATDHDAVIVTDWGLGLFSATTLEALCTRLRPRVDVLVGDVSGRRANLLAMRDLDLVCPGEGELRSALRNYDDGLTAVTWRLLDTINARAAIVTMAEEGLIAFGRRDEAVVPGSDWSSRLTADHVPALCRYAVDPLGCGDALLAAATLALTAGAPLAEAALLGAVAAAIEAQQLGNAVVGAGELRRGVDRLDALRLTYEPATAASSVGPEHAHLPDPDPEPA